MRMEELDALRNELAVKARNGIDFTLAASLLWLLIAFIWTLDYSAYNKCIFVFMVSALLLPMALLLSKVFKTQWKIKDNPLQPLGLYLNFAQLFYFPFLIFAIAKTPAYFIMAYAIITGAHLFPYAWFYKSKGYAIVAGVIAVGAVLLGLMLASDAMYFIAIFTSLFLFILTGCLYIDANKRAKNSTVL